jgi:cellulose synthase/poly-beta-1,6-N-acetylglucosamine synthase-like glycosyltransferase
LITAILQTLLTVAALLLLLPAVVLFVEAAAATPRKRGSTAARSEARPLIAIIMPAHDESSIIANTLRALLPQLQPVDRLIVVADNCSDDTALIASKEGAEVLVRTDPVRRGKGYALDFAVRHLESQTPPEVVLIIDADCQVAPGSIELLAASACSAQRPTQALYLMYAPPGAGLMTRIGQFAWTVKNQVRATGLHRLGLPCQLMGTGMAFPWKVICNAALATGHIVEDVKLGIELSEAGTAPLFCPEALVTSFFPLSSQGLRSQRTRWEHGHLGLVFKEAPRLFLKALTRGDPRLLALAFDLCVPPLALLLLAGVGLWAVSVLLYVMSGALQPLALATAALGLLACAILLAWARYGRDLVSLGTLAFAGIYALWKIPLYARFLLMRQLEWVRSKRD